VFAFVFFLFFFVRHDDDDDAVVVTMFPSFSSRSDDFFFLKTLSVFVCVLSRQVKIKKKEGKKISPIRCPTKKNKKNLSLLPYYSLSLTTQKKLYINLFVGSPLFEKKKKKKRREEEEEAMATTPGGGAASARKIALAAARIFQTALNDTNLPTGRKLLKRALIGPTLTSWYPERIRKLDALFEDPDDRRRKVKLERMKRRGKGPPKKGEGKRAKKK